MEEVFVCMCVCVFLYLFCVCVCQCELGCSTLSPTSDGGIWPAAEDEEELGGEALWLELPVGGVEEEVTAGRIRGGGGWLWGARFWSGRVCRGGGWRRRLGGAEGGAGRSRGGGWEREEGVWVEEGGEEPPAESEGESSIFTSSSSAPPSAGVPSSLLLRGSLCSRLVANCSAAHSLRTSSRLKRRR